MRSLIVWQLATQMGSAALRHNPAPTTVRCVVNHQPATTGNYPRVSGSVSIARP